MPNFYFRLSWFLFRDKDPNWTESIKKMGAIWFLKQLELVCTWWWQAVVKSRLVVCNAMPLPLCVSDIEVHYTDLTTVCGQARMQLGGWPLICSAYYSFVVCVVIMSLIQFIMQNFWLLCNCLYQFVLYSKRRVRCLSWRTADVVVFTS